MMISPFGRALLLALFSARYANGHTRGSSSASTSFHDEAPRQLQNNGGGASGLIETRDCMEFSAVNPSVLNNVNTDGECMANACSGGCCRLFSWLVCDTKNEFTRLSCLCNENTATKAPTPTPSAAPSPAPTFTPQPSDLASASPSDRPSYAPSPLLSVNPTTTFKPSETPTDRPTGGPTGSPSERPSVSPSFKPSGVPSASPTITPYFTEDTTDDSGNPLRSSTCLVAPSKLQFVHKVTYTYEYEVYAPVAADPASTVENYLNDQIHDEVARKFLNCNFEDDDLWIIQSEPHALNTDQCRGALPPNEQCFLVTATDSIWVYDAPGNRRELQQTSQAAIDFVTDINSYLNNAMADGVFDGPDDVSQTVYVNDGSNPIVTKSPTPGPSSAPSDPPPTNADGEQNDLQSTSAEEEEGLSTQIIIVIALAVGGVLLLILLLTFLRRGNRRQRQLDYLEKADLDLVQQITSVEAHVDLDSMPEEVVVSGMDDDPYTSSTPTRRSQRAPLHSQDELDQAFGNHRGAKEGKSTGRRPFGRK